MTPSDVAPRVLEGAAVAAVVAGAAWRAGSLTASGACAAVLVGTAACAAGWSWAALLIAFFVASSALSRVGEAEKTRRTGDVVAKGGARDAMQVLANGGPFAAAALAAAVLGPSALWLGLGGGALAASTADTWGTEIGTLVGGTPRLVAGWRAVPAGTSGAVSGAGSAASLAGALGIAGLAAALGWPVAAAVGTAAGGIAGAAADSLLGATLQQRRWCERCNVGTERAEHGCGAVTVHCGGLAWLENDRVNFLASLAGAAVGGAVAWWVAASSGA